MFLKRRTRTKDGKTHVYYSVGESLRVSRTAVVQRQILRLGELHTTQLDVWQRSIDVLHDEGPRRQLRLFTDRDQAAPDDPDVVEVKLSSFAVKSPRRFGDCWAAFQLWCDLGFDPFWRDALAAAAGDVPWDKVLALLAANRLLAPRSEPFVHEKWLPQSALDLLLDTDARVADSPRERQSCQQTRRRKSAYLTGQGPALSLPGPRARAPARARTTPRAEVAGPLRRELRSVALRFDLDLFRGRRRGGAQGPARLLARSPARLQTTRAGAHRHARRLPAHRRDFSGQPSRSHDAL